MTGDSLPIGVERMNSFTSIAPTGSARLWALPTSSMARIQRAVEEVRCQCVVCGSHVYATPGVKRGGNCGNCGSFELKPLS